MVAGNLTFVQSPSEKLLWKKLKFVMERLHEWERDWEPDPNNKKHVTLRRSFQSYLRRERERLAQDLDALEWIEIED